jgi:CheY-like chemotaxis protein
MSADGVHEYRLETRGALGQLASGMAHELNNLFTVILASAYGLRVDPTRSAAETRAEVEKIEEAIRRGADIVGHVLGVAFRDRMLVRPTDLAEAARSAELVLRRKVPEHVELLMPERALSVGAAVDVASVAHMLMILVDNAVRAEADRIEVVVDRVRRDEGRGSHLQASDFARLAVTDTGCGMTCEVVKRVFEPFYTTRTSGEGSGLGLPAFRGLVEPQGGRVEIESIPGSGTTVSMLFAPARVEAEPQTEPLVGVPVEQPRVLLVDDMGAIRGAVRKALTRIGCAVVEAEDGRAGLEAFRAAAGSINLIVSDVAMPGLSGPEMYRAICAEVGPVPVLFISGYSAAEVAQQDLLEPHWPLLTKPFDVVDLIRTVSAMTGQVAQTPAGRSAAG